MSERDRGRKSSGAGEDLPNPEAVASRADGRPPEEKSSDDPVAQSEAILKESEERVAKGAEKAKPSS